MSKVKVEPPYASSVTRRDMVPYKSVLSAVTFKHEFVQASKFEAMV